uniref:Helicase ATP-binding domain-containing protein n=1 Tax=viral metagenome TaxID=1070528 RepID=A0A6C0ACH4_9ZZZZ
MKDIQKKLSHKVLTKRGYILNKKNLTQEELKKIKKDLIVSPKVMDYGEPVKPFEVYKEDKDFICVPRFYGVDNYGKEKRKVELKGELVNFKFNGEPRDIQKPVINKTIDVLKDRGGGILKLYCGFGKTVVAIYIASQLKVKTLILVHKTSLQNQWYDRIKSFTNAKVGLIRQNKIDVEGKDIVVGMLQSIAMKDYDLGIFKDFGLVVCDECFTYDTKIKVKENGSEKILKIGDVYSLMQYSNKIFNKIGKQPIILEALSFNENTHELEYKSITNVNKNYKPIIKLIFNNKTYNCTSDHKFLTIYGYHPAYSLQNKPIISQNGLKFLNSTGLQIFYGLYLLGSIKIIKLNLTGGFFKIDFTNSKNGCFNSGDSTDYNREYKNWILKLFETENSQAKTCISNVIYFEDYNHIIKENELNRDDIINNLDIVGLSFVLHTTLIDYNIGAKTNDKLSEVYLNFLTHQQANIFSNRLTLNNVNNRFVVDKFNNHKIVFDMDTKKNSTEIIAPYFPQNRIHIFDDTIDTSKINCHKFNPFENYKVEFVKKIVNVNVPRHVFDITVKDNHNFVLDNGVIVHNCHHFASRVFSQALYKVGSNSMLGLSATPYRNDGLTKILNWYIGDIIFNMERKGDKRVIVKFIESYYEDKKYVEKKRWMKGAGVKPNVPIMVNDIVQVKKRNRFMVDCLINIINQPDRKILVLSDRIAHLESLKKMLDEDIKQLEQNEELEKDEVTTSLYIGRMKTYELEDAQKADIIFASFAIASEGLDIPDLNALILATSKSDVIQCVGRILRKQLKEGDMPPIIIDIADQYSVFERQGNKRKEYYQKKKYTIDNYFCYDGKLTSKVDFIDKTCNEDYAELFREDMSESDEVVPVLKDALNDGLID